MTRLNILLLMALVGCALSVVTSQHKARKLFMDLQTEQDRERKTDQEWRELQIESQTLGTGKRIEQKAQRELGMVVPDPKKTVIVVLDSSAESNASASAAQSNNAGAKQSNSKSAEVDTQMRAQIPTQIPTQRSTQTRK